MKAVAKEDPAYFGARRRAWKRYLARLRNLHGDEYEMTEPFAWEALEEDLERARVAALSRRV